MPSKIKLTKIKQAKQTAILTMLSLLVFGCGSANTPANDSAQSQNQKTQALENSSNEYLTFGAGKVATVFNPKAFECKLDHTYWIINAGVTLPAGDACTKDGKLVGKPKTRIPHVTGPADKEPVATHRWWGSVPFLGEMKVDNPDKAWRGPDSSPSGTAYITPDPVMAMVNDKGVRVTNLSVGMKTVDENNFQYLNPDLDAEVVNGVAIANSMYDDLNANMKASSDASITIEWESAGQSVMEATFVHGSPYIFVKAFRGKPVLKTLHDNGQHKGIFFEKDNTIGIWTNVSGDRQDFLVVGEGDTTYRNITGREITIDNNRNEMTLVLLPKSEGKSHTLNTIKDFASKARNVVSAVDVSYAVNNQTNEVTVTHHYRDQNGELIDTLAGLQPLHWKNLNEESPAFFSPYKMRSARGVTKFANTNRFSYALPFIGVLPLMPSDLGDYDMPRLRGYINDFMTQEQSQWNRATDTYWAGKNYGKVAELAAIARSIGMNKEADKFIAWLKLELEDWFNANSSGALDTNKYFVYDAQWHTLLGVEASFGSQFMLNDHHFHYGYFVRAAAEICRIDLDWCSSEQYGPMVELLIRDFAGAKNDPMFPYLRNFDPANGFSWASGAAPYSRGNNNESTSEAANAYGAMILYGLITKDQALTDRGIYLHASTTETYWQYWNNIDGYKGDREEADNFPADYDKITTSIIWGDGALFDTWFSRRYAHILGIQGLPTNPLIVHVAQYHDYMKDYVKLGLKESSNGKPSGLAHGQWQDIWWSLWAMVDAEAALADYNTVDSYIPEQGETKAHTYHWLHTWKNLGQLVSGSGSITADNPATMVFKKDNKLIYVAYNYDSVEKVVSFSDGTQLQVKPNSFATRIAK